MKTTQKLSNYFNNTIQEVVVVENTLFQFNKSTYQNEAYVTVFFENGETIYTADELQFQEFVKSDYSIDQLKKGLTKHMNKAEVQTIKRVMPQKKVTQEFGLFNTTDDNKTNAKTEAEAILEANKLNIEKALESFFDSEDKAAVNIKDLVLPAPSFIYKEERGDGSTIEITRPGGVTNMSYINGNVVLSNAISYEYTDLVKGEGHKTAYLYNFRDERFQELFFKQVLKSTSIGLSLGFNFSALSPKIPQVPTTVEENGKAKPKNGGNDFNMDFNFAQQKFKQIIKLRKNFLTINDPIMIVSTNLKTGEKTILNVAAEKERAEKELKLEES